MSGIELTQTWSNVQPMPDRTQACENIKLTAYVAETPARSRAARRDSVNDWMCKRNPAGLIVVSGASGVRGGAWHAGGSGWGRSSRPENLHEGGGADFRDAEAPFAPPAAGATARRRCCPPLHAAHPSPSLARGTGSHFLEIILPGERSSGRAGRPGERESPKRPAPPGRRGR